MRESGILMHITSLPGSYGIGTMGKQARCFVDFLRRAGQRCWQVLPLNPTGYGDSPYQSCSAYAGNPYLIDLETLIEQGLLAKEEVEKLQWSRRADRVDYGLLYENRLEVLRKAYARFRDTDGSFARFRAENDSWLPDYGIYMALKERNQGKPWYEWEPDIRYRKPHALAVAFVELAEPLRFYCFVQYLFDRQWNALRDYAHENGVRIIGDVPIYVPYDSADVWSDPELFQLDEEGKPTAVAGVPPDGFTEDGQLWGNPLYRWEKHAQDDYAWWTGRLAAAGKRYDVVRLDHFRGFESYWSVPYGERTAKNGCWVKGPGSGFIQALKRKLSNLPMIAEDLGYLTPQVRQLLRESGYPGMKVLEFAFDSREPSDYLPHTYSQNAVCYTGTHDNMTCRQWLDTAGSDAVEYAVEYMGLTEKEGYVWGMIRTAFASVADLCVIQLQDCLDLGAEARMNFPGTVSTDNWTWRAPEDFASPALAEKLLRLTKLYCRLGS